MDMESGTLPTVHLEQMAEWEAWLQSIECAELLASDVVVEARTIQPKTVVEVKHYAARMDRFSRGIFHVDDVSRHPLLLHKYKLMLPAFQKGIGIVIIDVEDKASIDINDPIHSPPHIQRRLQHSSNLLHVQQNPES